MTRKIMERDVGSYRSTHCMNTRLRQSVKVSSDKADVKTVSSLIKDYTCCYIIAMSNWPYISRESFNVNQFRKKSSFQLVKDNNFKCKL